MMPKKLSKIAEDSMNVNTRCHGGENKTSGMCKDFLELPSFTMDFSIIMA
jgi:hypothetical protein